LGAELQAGLEQKKSGEKEDKKKSRFPCWGKEKETDFATPSLKKQNTREKGKGGREKGHWVPRRRGSTRRRKKNPLGKWRWSIELLHPEKTHNPSSLRHKDWPHMQAKSGKRKKEDEERLIMKVNNDKNAPALSKKGDYGKEGLITGEDRRLVSKKKRREGKVQNGF